MIVWQGHHQPAQERSHTPSDICINVFSVTSSYLITPHFLKPWHSEEFCNFFPGTLAFLDTQKEQEGSNEAFITTAWGNTI